MGGNRGHIAAARIGADHSCSHHMESRLVTRRLERNGIMKMTNNELLVKTCRSAAENSDDLIIELPSHLLEIMDLAVGDEISFETVDNLIIIKKFFRKDHNSL